MIWISFFFSFLDFRCNFSPWTIAIGSAIRWESSLHQASSSILEWWRMSCNILGRFSGMDPSFFFFFFKKKKMIIGQFFDVVSVVFFRMPSTTLYFTHFFDYCDGLTNQYFSQCAFFLLPKTPPPKIKNLRSSAKVFLK